jgi:hypothetical protein
VEGVLGDRDRARELEVMLGAADPHGRRHERVEAVGDQPREMIAEQRIGGQGQVRAVLLGGAERDHDGVAPCLDRSPDLGPRHPIQLDRTHSALLSAKSARAYTLDSGSRACRRQTVPAVKSRPRRGRSAASVKLPMLNAVAVSPARSGD